MPRHLLASLTSLTSLSSLISLTSLTLLSALSKEELPETVPVTILCLKGELEGDLCVQRRQTVARCEEGFNLRKSTDLLPYCERLTSSAALTSCDSAQGYKECDYGYECCKEIEAPRVTGCGEDAKTTEDGKCVEMMPLPAKVICPEDYTPSDTRCQRSLDYDCSPVLPVLTRGPLNPKAKKPTEQTYVVQQTCRDVTTVPGELVCPEGSFKGKKQQCLTEVITDTTDRCSSDSPHSPDKCVTLDTSDFEFSCGDVREELVCSQKRVRLNDRGPKTSVLKCQCEMREVEEVSVVCVRGELSSLTSADGTTSLSCNTITSPVRRCPPKYRLTEVSEVSGGEVSTVCELSPVLLKKQGLKLGGSVGGVSLNVEMLRGEGASEVSDVVGSEGKVSSETEVIEVRDEGEEVEKEEIESEEIGSDDDAASNLRRF